MSYTIIRHTIITAFRGYRHEVGPTFLRSDRQWVAHEEQTLTAAVSSLAKADEDSLMAAEGALLSHIGV